MIRPQPRKTPARAGWMCAAPRVLLASPEDSRVCGMDAFRPGDTGRIALFFTLHELGGQNARSAALRPAAQLLGGCEFSVLQSAVAQGEVVDAEVRGDHADGDVLA